MRKSYPTLDSFVHWRESLRPIVWADEFMRAAPLEVEIGYGNGEYLIRRAAEHPDRNFIGIELYWESIKRAMRRIKREGIENVRLLLGDANELLPRVFEPETIDHVYSLFPCPWPKGRHEHHRLFTRECLQVVNSRLRPAAAMRIVTDHAEFRDWVLTQTGETGFDVACTETPAGFETKYERKWIQGGQQIFYEINMTKAMAIHRPLTEDYPMKTYRLDDFNAAAFAPEGCTGNVVVEFKEWMFDPEREKVMIRAFVGEPDMKQNVWIEIAKKDGVWVLRPAIGGGAIPTRGLQVALDRVRDAALRKRPREVQAE